jgi:4-amino-4-deoxy-L-arabinose transferase-like glycosyltransferase
VLPGMVLVVWLALARRPRTILALLAWWPGWLLLAVVAGPWFVLMQREFAEFSYYFFYVQHFARFAEGGFNNPQPVWFYPVVLLVLALPWSLWMLKGLLRCGDAGPSQPGLRLLLWLWLALITLFFSLPKSKLIGYILPVAFPLGLLAADTFARVLPVGRRTALLWRASAVVGAVASLVAIGWATARPPHSTQQLGLAIHQRMAPGDRVLFLHGYYFDIPFYARLRAPVVVVEHWDSPEIRKRDNWRKELADAGDFAPDHARGLLVLPRDLPETLCGSGVTWVVGEASTAKDYPLLAAAGEVVARQGNSQVWRIPGDAPALSATCRGTPSASPAGKS